MYVDCWFEVACRLRALTPALCVLLQFESLDLVTPSQAAELTLTSGALNSTSQMELVFDRLHKGEAFRNVDEFLTALTDEKVNDSLTQLKPLAQTTLAGRRHL